MSVCVHHFSVRARPDCLGAAVQVRQIALAFGWPTQRAAELSLVVAELATNLVRHAGGGRCEVVFQTEQATVEARDAGRGFPADVLANTRGEDAASRTGLDGFGSLGAGLGCVRRLASELTLDNLPAGGALARARLFRERAR